jgi:hypothetical protein
MFISYLTLVGLGVGSLSEMLLLGYDLIVIQKTEFLLFTLLISIEN